jgi:DNA polymerase-1
MSNIKSNLGLNPSSPNELGHFLLEELSLPIVKKTKKGGKPSFDKEAMKVYDELLQQVNDNRASLILTYRGWQKTTSSNYRPYLEMLDPDGRLRASFKQHGTVTGRLSCEKPNLQQIPRVSENDWNGHLKSAIIVESGRTAWEVDFSQGEFRLGTAYAKQRNLIDIFNDSQRDIFEEMAKDLGMTRNNVKTLNYLLQYGGGEGKISSTFGVSHLAAKAIKGNYYKNYPGLAKAANLALLRCRQNGFVKYWTGRRRHLPYLAQDEGHLPFNSVIQGGFFEIVKRQMIRCDEAGLNNEECYMDLQVHDSVRFDIEDGKEGDYLPEIKRIMEDVQPDFGVKFRVDIKKWGEK